MFDDENLRQLKKQNQIGVDFYIMNVKLVRICIAKNHTFSMFCCQQVMHDAEMSNTQSLTLGRNPRRRTTADSSPNGSRYATAPRHSSLDSRVTAQGIASNSLSRATAGKSPR